MTKNAKLSAKKKRAVQLLAGGMTGRAVADAIGMNETSVSRWKKEPEFRDALRAAEEEKLQLLTNKVNELMLRSAGVLDEFLEDDEKRYRLRAAAVALANGPKLREHAELSERIAQLERELNLGS